MGRTARGNDGRGHALLLLLPEELMFLRYLKQAKVGFKISCIEFLLVVGKWSSMNEKIDEGNDNVTIG